MVSRGSAGGCYCQVGWRIWILQRKVTTVTAWETQPKKLMAIFGLLPRFFTKIKGRGLCQKRWSIFMKESIGFVVVTYMVMGQKYMGKLQKYCDARKRLRRVKGQWSEVDLSQSQSVFFVRALTNLHLVILFPYISLLLFHIYIYIQYIVFWFYGFFVFWRRRHLFQVTF